VPIEQAPGLATEGNSAKRDCRLSAVARRWSLARRARAARLI
jgi:hypothetical protein